VRKELKDLLQTLNAQIIPKIHQERDPEARGDIFRFPQEMALLAPRIEDCLSETFGPSRYHKPVMFRGFFFTSALSTHDLLAAAAREGEWSFQKGFAPAGGDYAKGFFLLRLLEKCIIPEARLAAVDKDHVWSQRFRRFGPQIAAATLFLFAGVFLGLSFVNNYQRLDTLSTVYAAFASEQEKRPTIVDPGAALPELSHLARSIDVYQPGADSEITLGLGLYQGRTFEPAVDAAYLGALNSRLMPAVRDVAARKVEAALDGNMGDLKNALRAYLMLCRPEFLNRNFIDRWLGRRWAERYAGQTAVQNNLRDSMDYLIAHGIVPVAPDAALLDRARRALLKTPPAELVYQRLQEEAKESGKPPFTFRAAIGESPFDGDTFPIPALYTRAGYDEYLIERCPDIIRELTDESWIFDKNPLALRMLDVTKVHREVMVMYFRDYTQHWNQALQRLAVRMPQTIADARNLAGQLTAGAPPAVLALREIRANTSFSPDSAAPGAVESAAQQELARKAKQRLARATGARLAGALVGQAQKDAESLRNESALAAEREAASVRQFFAPLTALLDDTGNAGTVLKATNDSMAAAAEYFARIVSSDDREQRVLTALLEIADEKDETLRRVEIAAEPLPSPLREWYSTVVSGGLRDMLAIGASAINRAYRVKVLAGYNSKLRHCYPFNMHTDVDANLEDFADFFRSGGLLDSFYDANLLPFVGKNGLRSIMGRTLPISALALGQLQRANRVQQAFFLSGRELGISFLMEPHAMDAQLKEITLRNADKTLSYWHGPVEGARLAWPNGDKASLNFIDLNNIDLKTEARGDWALFRILRSGSIKRQEGNTCLIEVQKNGKWGQFLIQFRNRVNPFDPSVCSFRLPDSLL
jgi:type VI secretion system protein ImpL